MSDNEPRIISEYVSHPAGGGDAISNSAAVVSKLDALTQSVQRLVHTKSADTDFDESILLKDGGNILSFALDQWRERTPR